MCLNPKQVAILLDQGWIIRVQSGASHEASVVKPDGTWRFCQDRQNVYLFIKN